MARVSAQDLPGARWRKSTRSNGGGAQCVLVTRLPGGGALADSKDMAGPALLLGDQALRGLLASLKPS